MGTTVLFKPTAIQKKALLLLKGGAKHILLFGGSRSGKTTVLVMALIYRALRFAGSRHLICRYRAKDARSSVLRETLLPWLDNTIGKGGYTYLAHESMVTLYNGSEIWIGGLGDREQADKILGHEYNTIYFNEISQLSYAAVTTAYSRLAMRVPGCRNLFVYDCNPGSPLHWAYKIFVLKKTFLSGEQLEKPELYQAMVLNPEDNKDNLPEDYIIDILDVLPEKQKARFRDGLWVKAEGVIYDKFDETMIVKAEDLPTAFDRYAAGQDFGLNITFVKIGWIGDVIYVLRDYGAFNMTTQSFNEELTARGWLDCGGLGLPVYCDPAGNISKRQMEIIRLLCNGFTGHEICGVLAIAEDTLSVQKRKMYTCLNVRNENELIRVALFHGWIKVEELRFYGGEYKLNPAPEKPAKTQIRRVK